MRFSDFFAWAGSDTRAAGAAVRAETAVDDGGDGTAGGAATSLRRSSGTSRSARRRELSSFARTSFCFASTGDSRSEEAATDEGGGSIAICEMSRRDATSFSSVVDGATLMG